MSKIEGVIFDWAGTTIDFGCFAPVEVFVQMFKQAGIEVTIQEAREPMGMSKIDHVRTMLEMPRIRTCWEEVYQRPHTEEDVEALYAVFESTLLASLKTFTDPIPGVLDTIKALRNKGLKIGSTTGYTSEMMEIVTKEAAQKGYQPDCFVTSDDVHKMGRPYPYMIFKNIEKLNITSVDHVIKVGDTVSDIQEAKAAGITAIGVMIGSSEMGITETEWQESTQTEKNRHIERTKAVFKQAGADFTIDSLEALLPLLDEIEKEASIVK